MSILIVNRSETKHVLPNGMITWSSLAGVLNVDVPFSVFKNNIVNLYPENISNYLRLCLAPF